MTSFYDEWKKKSEEYKPSKETDQSVLWLKQMAIMSPHFKELYVAEPQIKFNEMWVNAFGQMCYDMGTKCIDKYSYNKGRWDERVKIMKSLGFMPDCNGNFVEE